MMSHSCRYHTKNLTDHQTAKAVLGKGQSGAMALGQERGLRRLYIERAAKSVAVMKVTIWMSNVNASQSTCV